MPDPTVSIITPSYNQGQFIEKTIQSVLSQDYTKIEYMVVDGGSNDNTIEILRHYGSQLKWISEKDRGQADAINKGINQTTGKILYWLNSDDLILPGAVSKAVTVFKSHSEIQLLYGKAHFTDPSGNIIGSYPTEPFNFQRLAMFNFISQPSVFFKRDAFDSVGGLNPRLNYALDYDLWIKIGKRFKTTYVPEYLSCYRLHESSKTVDPKQILKSLKENIDVVYGHYGWAPAHKLYGYCYYKLENKAMPFLGSFKPLKIPIALIWTLGVYLTMNRSLRLADLTYLNLKNIRKLGADWGKLHKIY